MASIDLEYPACCEYCPHRQSVSGACDHDLRQSLIGDFRQEANRTCPVFRAEKTTAMERLLARFDAEGAPS